MSLSNRSFAAGLFAELRRTPWILVAAALHGLVFAALLLLPVESPDASWNLVVGWKSSRVLEPEPVFDGAPGVDPDDRLLKDPVIQDAKVSDHCETDNDLPFEETLGKRDLLSDAPFEGPSTNAAIGIGGGSGGAFVGRGGHRNLRAMGGGARLAESEPWRYAPTNTEGYDAVEEQTFQDPARSPLSTFGVDVDTASYANVRRFLRAGERPPAGAVRIEEMLNYFTYSYAQPDGSVPFSVFTEVAECPWNRENRLVRIGLQGKSITEEETPARNLVFLIDVSGSMRSQDKLPLVRNALALLADRLRPEDRVAIVVYAGASGVVLEPTSGDDRATVRAALLRLEAGGSTNGGQGIRRAYQLARRNFAKGGINRVILATDGDFNVGVTGRGELVKLIEKERESGVFLTVLGVGTGNLKDSQMEMLADKGNGNYAYLDSLAEAEKVLVREAGSTLVTIAKDVKIQVEFNPTRVGAYRLIGYENRKLAARDFNDDQKDAGEIGAGHSVTALYEVTPAGTRAPGGTIDPLRYQEPSAPSGSASANELLTVKLRYKKPDGDESRLLVHPVTDPGGRSAYAAGEDFCFATAVAAFGMLLGESDYAGDASYAMVAELAGGAIGEDPHGDRREFLTLVEKAKALR